MPFQKQQQSLCTSKVQHELHALYVHILQYTRHSFSYSRPCPASQSPSLSPSVPPFTPFRLFSVPLPLHHFLPRPLSSIAVRPLVTFLCGHTYEVNGWGSSSHCYVTLWTSIEEGMSILPSSIYCMPLGKE